MKRTKIVATVGPASISKDTLKEMIDEGVNVFRLNFSHGTHEDHKLAIQNIRALDDEYGVSTAILCDLQGPKIRIGQIEGGEIEIVGGETIIITNVETLGTKKKISTNYQSFPLDVNPGEQILLNDGKLRLEVIHSDKKEEVKCKVIHGGVLSSKKGINLPSTSVSLPCLTEKDLEDLEFALEHDLEWIALSFVRSARDIIELKHIINTKEKDSKVIAKIEKPEAIVEMDDIIKETDAVMIARGDLGVEIPMQNVPLIQKKLIKKCIHHGKPVIVATQMLESMIDNVVPTRAEVNDVANAVLDGADAVMLSAETSVGEYPVEVIRVMTKIIQEMELQDQVYYHEQLPDEPTEERFVTDSICFNACWLAKRTNARAIVTMSFSGYTGFKISSQRPHARTYVFTGNKKILKTMNLVWGVEAFFYDKMVSTDHTMADIKYILKRAGRVDEGDYIVNVASMPIAEKGMSNMMKLSKVE